MIQSILFLLLPGCLYDRDQLDIFLTYIQDDDGDGYKEIEEDCNDANPDIHPGVPEICDGFDNDCDGTIDVDAVDTKVWYQDLDGDGYGNEDISRYQCMKPDLHSGRKGDCDDSDPATYPSAPEECSAIKDYNCDGRGGDQDGDGYYLCDDCYDDDPNSYRNAPEICDGVDNNCNGSIDDYPVDGAHFYYDQDDDGYGVPDYYIYQCEIGPHMSLYSTDCDDTDSQVHPGRSEICNNGIDDNCNGDNAEDTCRLNGSLSPTTTYEGDWVGDAVRIVPDQDGDGRADILIDSPSLSNSTGTIYLISGGGLGSMTASSAAWMTVENTQLHQAFGTSMDGGFDVTGDGVPDVIANGGGTNSAGIVYIFPIQGGTWFLADVATTTITGGVQNGLLSYNHLHLWPDVDSDGNSEISMNDQGDTGPGTFYIFNHSLTGDLTAADADITFVGENMFDAAGNGATALDYDGDGLNDWAISAEYENNGAGAIYLVSSPANGSYSLVDADVKLKGQPSDQVGGLWLESYDINNDGLDDLITTSNHDAADPYASSVLGVVAPFHTGGVAALFTIYGEKTLDRLVVHRAADLDQDGRMDLVVGAPDFENTDVYEGKVGIFYGSLVGQHGFSSCDASYESVTPNALAGSSVDVGDVTGDGWLDLVIGESGTQRVVVLDGNAF